MAINGLIHLPGSKTKINCQPSCILSLILNGTKVHFSDFSTHGELFSKSYWINSKSDCIYQFPIDFDPNGLLYGSKSVFLSLYFLYVFYYIFYPFFDWFGSKQTTVWFQINRRMINTIWFRVDFQSCFVCTQKKSNFGFLLN